MTGNRMNISDPSLHSAANHSVAIYLMKPLPLFLAFLIGISSLVAAPDESKTWTDPEVARREDPDFAIQGEYRNQTLGAQVVAFGGGKFEVYVLEGGLPGAGWEPGKSRIQLKGEKSLLSDDASKTSATLENGVLSITKADGTKHELARVERQSPTLNAQPPLGAVVLFDGSSADAWENGKMENGHLMAHGSTSKQHFGSYTLHLEFRTPYKPHARGQQRGNSGVYHSGRWETQVLDSFGLTGEQNECGGLYSIAKPRLNMCLPPLTWQTYDVEFTAAKFDAAGTRTAWPRLTVRLNGVLIHDNVELNKDFTTSAPLSTPLTSPEGPIHLQQHGNPVAFRNIWVLPGK
jgi:hypothetical protein